MAGNDDDVNTGGAGAVVLPFVVPEVVDVKPGSATGFSRFILNDGQSEEAPGGNAPSVVQTGRAVVAPGLVEAGEADKKSEPLSLADALLRGNYVLAAQMQFAVLAAVEAGLQNIGGNDYVAEMMAGYSQAGAEGATAAQAAGFSKDGYINDNFGGRYDRYGGYEFKDGSYKTSNGDFFDNKTNTYQLSNGEKGQIDPDLVKKAAAAQAAHEAVHGVTDAAHGVVNAGQQVSSSVASAVGHIAQAIADQKHGISPESTAVHELANELPPSEGPGGHSPGTPGAHAQVTKADVKRAESAVGKNIDADRPMDSLAGLGMLAGAAAAAGVHGEKPSKFSTTAPDAGLPPTVATAGGVGNSHYLTETPPPGSKFAPPPAPGADAVAAADVPATPAPAAPKSAAPAPAKPGLA